MELRLAREVEQQASWLARYTTAMESRVTVIPQSASAPSTAWSYPPTVAASRPGPVMAFGDEDEQPLYRSLAAMSSLSLSENSPPIPSGPPPPLRRQVTRYALAPRPERISAVMLMMITATLTAPRMPQSAFCLEMSE